MGEAVAAGYKRQYRWLTVNGVLVFCGSGLLYRTWLEKLKALSLALFKKHVRADDFSGDDDLLNTYLEAAWEWVVKATNRSGEELETMGAGTYPMALKQAAMMLAAHWYDNREAVRVGEAKPVPYGIEALVKPYTKLA